MFVSDVQDLFVSENHLIGIYVIRNAFIQSFIKRTEFFYVFIYQIDTLFTRL